MPLRTDLTNCFIQASSSADLANPRQTEDMMQYVTHNYLTATPHKVGLNTAERFSYAYFHEPNFQAIVKPIEGGICGSDGVVYQHP
jgi:isopenicillin N synthase-like dioxygenase